MNKIIKYIFVCAILFGIGVEVYIITFFNTIEEKAIPVIAKETKEVSINSVYDELILIGGIDIVETKFLDNNLVTTININNKVIVALEKVKALDEFRIISYKISKKEDVIELNMDIIKK